MTRQAAQIDPLTWSDVFGAVFFIGLLVVLSYQLASMTTADHAGLIALVVSALAVILGGHSGMRANERRRRTPAANARRS